MGGATIPKPVVEVGGTEHVVEDYPYSNVSEHGVQGRAPLTSGGRWGGWWEVFAPDRTALHGCMKGPGQHGQGLAF